MTRRPGVTRDKHAALDSAGHGRLRRRTLAGWGKDERGGAGGGGTWCLFSQCSCFGDRGSVPAAWRGCARHPPQRLNRVVVGLQQRRAGEGWQAKRNWAVTVSDPSFRHSMHPSKDLRGKGAFSLCSDK